MVSKKDIFYLYIGLFVVSLSAIVAQEDIQTVTRTDEFRAVPDSYFEQIEALDTKIHDQLLKIAEMQKLITDVNRSFERKGNSTTNQFNFSAYLKERKAYHRFLCSIAEDLSSILHEFRSPSEHMRSPVDQPSKAGLGSSIRGGKPGGTDD